MLLCRPNPFTWPQELGQPVQCMRTMRGTSSSDSSLRTTCIIGAFEQTAH